MKNCILILAVSLMMLGCGNKQVKQIKQADDDSTELTIKTPYDTVHFKFKWRDADSIPYLFGKPLKDKIVEYQRRFDSLHLTERYGFYDRIEYFRDISQFTAVNDFVSLWFADETTPYEDDWEMIVWRINECYPIDGSSSEMERYQGFSEQIDSLLSYSIGSQWDANVQAWLAAQLYHYKVEIYNNRLLDCSNSFKNLFVSEQCVWKEYEKALHDICDKIIVGKNGGSASPMIYSGFFIESYEQRLISLLDCYFTLKDFDYRSTEKHKLISDNMIHRAYSDFFHRLTDSDYEDYSADEKRNALRNDMRFWNKWMAERRNVSVQLPMPLKEVYDNCTNNLKRRKLIQLKNFYDGYGLTTSFTQELILHPDCSDEELFNYDYQKRNELMMTR